MQSISGRLIGGLATAAVGLALIGPPAAAAATSTTQEASAATSVAGMLVLKTRPRATISANRARIGDGRVQVTVYSNAKRVRISYRLRVKSRGVTVKLRVGTATRLLPAGTTTVLVQAKPTSSLKASTRLQVIETPVEQPAPNPPVPASGGTPVAPPPATSPATGGSSATPPAPADTTPPGAPSGLRATSVAHNAVSLVWTNPSDGDLSGIIVRRAQGRTPPATVAQGVSVPVSGGGTTASDSGVSANSFYSYAVFASDRAGNVSPGLSCVQ